MTNILHISNTDIDVDSRIRKELSALRQVIDARIFVIGVPDADAAGETKLDGARYTKMRLQSRQLKVLPRAVRYFFGLIEFTFKVVSLGWRMKPGIVHCHDTFALPAGWLLKKLLGCQLIYDAHELESNKNAQNAILSNATLLIEKFCWKRIDLLISVSDSIIDWYIRKMGNKSNVLILNSPVSAGDSHEEVVSKGRGRYFNEKFNIPSDHLIFVYLGILGPGRGVEICLDAFATGSKRAHVVFIGFGSLVQTITDYAGRNSNIHFHTALPHDEVVTIVRSADYGLCLIENVSLSDYYCLPNKLFEYCFASVPVLASNFPEIERLVDMYSLGVCCVPRVDCVRAAIAGLIGREPTRLTSDIHALSWDAQAERLRTAYQNLLAKR